MADAHLVKLFLDRPDVSVLIEEGIRDDEAFLFLHDTAKLIKGDGRAATLEIYLFRKSQPQHIFSPLNDCLDIQKIHNADIVGNGIAAPRTASQRQRGNQLKVVQITDAAL